MMRNIIITLPFALMLSCSLSAQQSLFEDKDGQSSIYFLSGSMIRFNTSDASAKLSFNNQVSTKNLFVGFDISGKTNDGVVSLLSKGNISPGVSINGIIGLKEVIKTDKHKSWDGWGGLKIGYTAASYKLFADTAVFADQVSKKAFHGLNTELNFNWKTSGRSVMGISAGFKQSNNYADLDELELTDRTTIVDSATGTIRSYESKIDVRSGKYSEFYTCPILFDVFYAFTDSSRLGMHHYVRGVYSESGFKTGFGTGIYLLKKDDVLSSIGGVSFQINDMSKIKTDFNSAFSINLVVGYTFK